MSQLAQRAAANTARQNDGPTIATVIGQLRPEIARALPKHMDADRMARIALTVLRKTPKLAECSAESFAGALLTAAQLGLEFGAAEEAYLNPYGGEATMVIGYKGMCKLFFQHPLARHLDAQAVYERDEFDYHYGLHPDLVHKPATGDRGPVIAFYAVASLTTGASNFVVLSPEDVKALRGSNANRHGSIADPMHWMSRKSCIRQVLKTMPKSTTMALALAADEVPVTAREFASARAIESGVAPAAIDSAPDGVDLSTGVIEDPPTEVDALWNGEKS